MHRLKHLAAAKTNNGLFADIHDNVDDEKKDMIMIKIMMIIMIEIITTLKGANPHCAPDCLLQELSSG